MAKRGRKSYPPNVVEFDYVSGLVYIHLQGKNGLGQFTITDITSYYKYNLKDYVWILNNNGYAVATTGRNIYMHRIISENTSSILHTDHVERLGKENYRLDNRKCNLRICTNQENQFNTLKRIDNKTGYKCVTEMHGKYRCQMRINKIQFMFGLYHKPEQAAYAYNLVASAYAGEYAQLNVIPHGSLTVEEKQIVHNKVNKRLEKIQSKLDVVA